MSHGHKLYFNLQLKVILGFLWQFHIQIGSRAIYAENEDSRFNLEKLQKPIVSKVRIISSNSKHQV